MDTTRPDFPALPAGFIPVKIGGRPKKEARDAAVFLAKIWRMESRGEPATTAEQWIVDAWEKSGSKASSGIGETAHVRSAIKRARDRGVNSSLLIFDHATGICTAVECEKTPDGATLQDGARSWHWREGMTEAALGEVRNAAAKLHQEIFHKSKVATAVSSLIQRTS